MTASFEEELQKLAMVWAGKSPSDIPGKLADEERVDAAASVRRLRKLFDGSQASETIANWPGGVAGGSSALHDISDVPTGYTLVNSAAGVTKLESTNALVIHQTKAAANGLNHRLAVKNLTLSDDFRVWGNMSADVHDAGAGAGQAGICLYESSSGKFACMGVSGQNPGHWKAYYTTGVAAGGTQLELQRNTWVGFNNLWVALTMTGGNIDFEYSMDGSSWIKFDATGVAVTTAFDTAPDQVGAYLLGNSATWPVSVHFFKIAEEAYVAPELSWE